MTGLPKSPCVAIAISSARHALGPQREQHHQLAVAADERHGPAVGERDLGAVAAQRRTRSRRGTARDAPRARRTQHRRAVASRSDRPRPSARPRSTSASECGCAVCSGPQRSSTPSSWPVTRVVQRRGAAGPAVDGRGEVLGAEDLQRVVERQRGAHRVGPGVRLAPARAAHAGARRWPRRASAGRRRSTAACRRRRRPGRPARPRRGRRPAARAARPRRRPAGDRAQRSEASSPASASGARPRCGVDAGGGAAAPRVGDDAAQLRSAAARPTARRRAPAPNAARARADRPSRGSRPRNRSSDPPPVLRLSQRSCNPLRA